MPQNKIEGAPQLETSAQNLSSSALIPLPVIFCEQVLASQYFGQIKPYWPTRKVLKTEILQNRSVFFLIRDLAVERSISKAPSTLRAPERGQASHYFYVNSYVNDK